MRPSGPGHFVLMRLIATLLTLGALTGLLAGSSNAAPGIRYGVQDDAWLSHGGGTLESRLDQLEALGVEIVRFNLHWNEIEPTRGSPNWETADAVLQGLKARRIDAVVGILGAPGWANGGKPPNYVPTAKTFAAFAGSAASRYSWVKQWLVWNEPNQARWLKPTTPATYVRNLLNPGYAAIHAANPGAKVAGGVTAPRAGAAGVSPVEWIRGMRAAGARLDAYAHHPYPARPSDTPFSGGCRQAGCLTITMATLERLLTEVNRAFGAKRIWLTEYGYQTGVGGVSAQRQADMIGQAALRTFRAPRVDMLIHYLVVDEPSTDRFQSGLFTLAGAAKPSAAAFSLPLVQAGRSGGKPVLWGQVRPGNGAQTFRLQIRKGSTWTFAAGSRRTNSRGYFSAAVPIVRGTYVRLWTSGGVGSALRIN